MLSIAGCDSKRGNINMWNLILVLESLILIMILQHVTTVLAKPTTATTTQVPATKVVTVIYNTQPQYELQLAVWPTDVDDIIEAVAPQNNGKPIHTLIEQPVAVMPDVDYTQNDEIDNDDDDVNDNYDHNVIYDPSSNLWPTIIGEQEPVHPDPVIVLENYHNKYANGSEEYKLVLSNGMVNYQRIDHVLVKGVLKPTQQGYYTIPMQYKSRESYQTTYYRADKNGYNVYNTIQSPRNPAYDIYLQYAKEQDDQIDKNN